VPAQARLVDHIGSRASGEAILENISLWNYWWSRRDVAPYLEKYFVVNPVIKRIKGRNSPSWLEDGENGKREYRAGDKSYEFLASAPRIEARRLRGEI